MKKFDIAAAAYKGLTREQWEKDLNYHPNFAEEVPIDDDVYRLSRIVFAPGADGVNCTMWLTWTTHWLHSLNCITCNLRSCKWASINALPLTLHQ